MEYCVIRNKALACAIAFATNEKYFTYEDKYDKTKKVYSFKRTNRFNYAMNKWNELKNELNNIEN